MVFRAAFLMLLTCLIAGPAKAERQTYNPYTTGVTYYQMEREVARQQRLAAFGVPDRYAGRHHRRVLTPEEAQVIKIERQLKQRFPIHPGLYRDAYDRGGFRP